MKTKLHKSKWGWAVHLNELGITLPNNRKEAFLQLGVNNTKFQEGMEIDVKIFFYVGYRGGVIGEEGTGGKGWKEIKTDNYDAALNHKDFIEFKLKKSSIVPYFNAII